MSISPQELQRTAHTVECLFDSLPMADGRERAEIEEWVVKWLCSRAGNGGYAIYHQGQLHCHAEGRVVRSFPLPGIEQTRAIWCDRGKISLIDGNAYAAAGALVMLGSAGLAQRPQDSGSAGSGIEIGSNNNNNNNNNNNG